MGLCTYGWVQSECLQVSIFFHIFYLGLWLKPSSFKFQVSFILFYFILFFCFLGLLSLHSLYTVLDLDPLILSTIHTYSFQKMVIWVFIPLLNAISLFSFMATLLVILFHFSFSAWKGELFPIWVSISVVKIAIFYVGSLVSYCSLEVLKYYWPPVLSLWKIDKLTSTTCLSIIPERRG